MYKKIYLNRGQVRIKEIRLRQILILQTLANFAVLQATPDLPPVLVAADPLLQPVRIISQSVLLIPPPRNNFTNTLIGNNKSKDGEAENQHNQNKHDKEIDPKEPGHATPGTNQPSKRDDHEKDTQSDNGSIKKLLTVGAGTIT